VEFQKYKENIPEASEILHGIILLDMLILETLT
jgi:hypothetical protein